MVDMQLSNSKLVDRGKMIMDEILFTYEQAAALLSTHGAKQLILSTKNRINNNHFKII
jgi:N-acetylmuramic acid 6-phosphate (MurNAc-6-P) etherase